MQLQLNKIPRELRDNIRETVATFIACGINPEKVLFLINQEFQHILKAWMLSCVARMGWLNRMTQFKEKAGKDKEKASIGLIFLSNINGCRYFAL